MEFLPEMGIEFLNGWILFGFWVLVQMSLLWSFQRQVRARLFDRSGWNERQRLFIILGKLVALVCIVLILLTPLKTGRFVFFLGIGIYLLGLALLVIAMFNFKTTPPDEPVRQGLYRLSRHPQIVALFIGFAGMCLAIGSWSALLVLCLSRILQHYSILAEEEACLRQYGESYRQYMAQIPRYFLFF